MEDWTVRAAGETRDPVVLEWGGVRAERVVLRFRKDWVGFRRDVVGQQPEFLSLRREVALAAAERILDRA